MVFTHNKFSPLDIAWSSILERATLPEPYLFLAIITNKEVIKAIDSMKSIRQNQDTVSNDVIGKNIDNHQMVITTPVNKGTGDQIIKEVINRI